MGIRKPLTTVLDYNDASNVGATSVAGGVAKTFNLPQDTENVLVKFTASIVGGGASAIFQTTDDAGTTWYDVQRTSIVSNANNDTAEWLNIPVSNTGSRVVSSLVATGSVQTIATSIGKAQASTLTANTISGLPVMDTLGRVFITYTAGVSANALSRVQVKTNSQSVGH